MNLLSNTYVVVALIAALLCVALAANCWRGRNAAHGYLAAWLLTRVLVLVLVAIEESGSGTWNTAIGAAVAWLTTLSGPLLLAYAISATQRAAANTWIYLPAVIHLALIPWFDLTVADCMPLAMVYAVAAATVVWQQRKHLQARVRREVWYVLSAIMTMHGVNLLILTLGDFAALEGLLLAAALSWAAVAVVILVSSSLPTNATPTETSGAAATGELDHLQYRRIVQIVEYGEQWRNCDLDLSGLALSSGLSETELSRLLNRFNEGGFYGYLNRLRTEHLCVLLADPSQARYTIEGLGREAGFATRSTMYRAFKERTGKTPSEFRRAHARPDTNVQRPPEVAVSPSSAESMAFMAPK